jgi:hypothetical protein
MRTADGSADGSAGLPHATEPGPRGAAAGAGPRRRSRWATSSAATSGRCHYTCNYIWRIRVGQPILLPHPDLVTRCSRSRRPRRAGESSPGPQRSAAQRSAAQRSAAQPPAAAACFLQPRMYCGERCVSAARVRIYPAGLTHAAAAATPRTTSSWSSSTTTARLDGGHNHAIIVSDSILVDIRPYICPEPPYGDRGRQCGTAAPPSCRLSVRLGRDGPVRHRRQAQGQRRPLPQPLRQV